MPLLNRPITVKYVLVAVGLFALYKAYQAYELVYQVVGYLSQVRS